MFKYIPNLFYFVMKLALPIVLLVTGTSQAAIDKYAAQVGTEDYVGLQEVYKDHFRIGTAMNSGWLGEGQEELEEFLLKNYSSFTLANEIKIPTYYTAPGEFNTTGADIIADYCRENNMKLRGHTLIWPTLYTWLPYNEDGSLVSKEVLYARMREYIEHVMTRYGDIIDEWDVVNEVFHYNPTPEFKDYNDMFTIAGSECVKMAFIIAKDYADENDKFFVNETKVLSNKSKEMHLFKYLEQWKKEGLKIDGVGLQCHLQAISTSETADRLQKILDRCRKLGLEVQLTEFEMSAYVADEADQPAFDSLPKWIETWQANKFQRFFKVLRDNDDIVSSVTFWGYADGTNGVKREDWPFLFDKNCKPKTNFFAVCDF